MRKGTGPTAEHNAVLNLLEPGESIALVTSAGLMHNGRVIAPMGRAFLTNRRVIYIVDKTMGTVSVDLKNKELSVERPASTANHIVSLDGQFSIVIPRQESGTFVVLAERYARDFERPAGWYFDPGSDDKLRYWNGSHWTEQLRERPAKPL